MRHDLPQPNDQTKRGTEGIVDATRQQNPQQQAPQQAPAFTQEQGQPQGQHAAPEFTDRREPPTDPFAAPVATTTTTDDQRDPQPDRPADQSRQAAPDDESSSLFAEDEVTRFRGSWREIQVAFVDDPRRAVHGADELVADVMRALATTFAEHKRELEGQWQQGNDVETEELRVALQRYRSFFNQLLNS